MPERHLPGLAGRWCDDDAVGADLVDAPRGGAQQEDLAHAALVHHLLVELADAMSPAPLVAGQEDAEETPVRDRPARHDRHHPRVIAALDRVEGAVPDDARLQLGELVGRVAAGEHVEHALELLPRQVAEGLGPNDQGVERIDGPGLHGAGRHDLLGEDVEGVSRDARLLDRPVEHASHDHGRFEQVAAVVRKDLADRRLTDLVPGSADPLEAGRHAGWRLDLHHQVDRPHVDPQLEARGRDERRQATRLQ